MTSNVFFLLSRLASSRQFSPPWYQQVQSCHVCGRKSAPKPSFHLYPKPANTAALLFSKKWINGKPMMKYLSEKIAGTICLFPSIRIRKCIHTCCLSGQRSEQQTSEAKHSGENEVHYDLMTFGVLNYSIPSKFYI